MNVSARRAQIRKVTVKRAKAGLRFGIELEFRLDADEPLRAFLSRATGQRPELLLPPPPVDGVAADGDAEEAQSERRAYWERELEVKARRPSAWSFPMSARLWALDAEVAADEEEDLEVGDLDEPDIRMMTAEVDRKLRFFILGAECSVRLTVTCAAALLAELTVARLSELVERHVGFELVGRQATLPLGDEVAAARQRFVDAIPEGTKVSVQVGSEPPKTIVDKRRVH